MQFRGKLAIVIVCVAALSLPLSVFAAGEGETSTTITEPVTIEFWHQWSPGQIQSDILDSMLAEFSDQTENITVNAVYMGDAGPQKITGALAAGDPPEIGWIKGIGDQYYENDQLIPMDRVYDDYITRDDVYPSLLRESQYLGKDITLPFEVSNLALQYDRQALSDKGIAFPSSEVGQQWTWDQWIDAAKQFTDPSQDKYGWEPRPKWPIAGAVFRQLGGEYLSEDLRTNLIVSDPAMQAKMVEALRVVRRIFVVDAIAPVPKDDQRFDNFDEPFEISGPWNLARTLLPPYGNGKYPLDRMGTMPLPVHADGQQATIWYQKALALFKTDAQHELATLKFIGWFYDAPNFARWSAGASYLPVTKSAAADSAWQNYVAEVPQVKVFVDQIPYMYFPADQHYLPHGRVGEMFDSIMFGRATPEEAVANYIQDAQQLLDEWWVRHDR